jgi:dihydroorotate dehydrogenase
LRYPISFLSGLPIRKIDFENPSDKSMHDKITVLVEQMIALHKNIAKAKSPPEKERIEHQIEDTDKAIDTIVYALYGLSDEEIKIVEK